MNAQVETVQKHVLVQTTTAVKDSDSTKLDPELALKIKSFCAKYMQVSRGIWENVCVRKFKKSVPSIPVRPLSTSM